MRDSNLTRLAAASGPAGPGELALRKPHQVPYLLRQIVHLQSDGIRTCAFDGVNHFHNVSVLSGSGCLYEDCLLDAIFFLHVGARFHSDLVSALVLALLKHLIQALRERRRIVDRTERILIQDRKSTRLNSSHVYIAYAVSCL